ncbi:MAG TPA: tetratricopeptide repeat protein, partial [bacterium]|nr:tetratricopeptide repeat protein [bacterium]
MRFGNRFVGTGKGAFARGLRLARQGRLQRAVSAFDEALRADPRNAACYDARGKAYVLLKKLSRALEDFNRALELAPQQAEYYNNR